MLGSTRRRSPFAPLVLVNAIFLLMLCSNGGIYEFKMVLSSPQGGWRHLVGRRRTGLWVCIRDVAPAPGVNSFVHSSDERTGGAGFDPALPPFGLPFCFLVTLRFALHITDTLYSEQHRYAIRKRCAVRQIIYIAAAVVFTSHGVCNYWS